MERFSEITIQWTADMVIEEAHRCLLCEDAPCNRDCPAGIDVKGFIRRLRFEDLKGSCIKILQDNIFGGTCGRVCPTEVLCQKECSRRLLGRPIEIGRLQSFAVDEGLKRGELPIETPKKNGRRVAVIGGGPSGLQAAISLSTMGYEVTVFEREEKVGGLLYYGIPVFRLPFDVVRKEIELIKSAGVEFVMGKEVTFEGIREISKGGFDAIFISTGLSKPLSLDIEGIESSGVETALNFLKRVKIRLLEGGVLENLSGSRVVVIGGGGVAIDSALTSVMLGADDVLLLSLESFLEMPSFKREKEEALAHGVKFIGRVMVDRIESIGTRVAGVSGNFIKWKEPGRFLPENAEKIEASSIKLPADRVIIAIGQKADEEFEGLLKRSIPGHGFAEVHIEEWGSHPPILLGGDLTNPMRTVVHSVASGKRAAVVIDEKLSRK